MARAKASRKRDATPEGARAKRLEDVVRRGPRPPRSPHEFVQDRMRQPPPPPGKGERDKKA